MNRLFRVLHRWKCKTAAHKLALDALRHLGDDHRWPGVFLWHVEPYLRGVEAPEAEFRDYPNHVLYPVESWGGAARLARKWYWKTVERLRAGEWSAAAYDAGVLARYVTYPFSPPRAGHDPAALGLRTPIEWCVSRLYDDLTAEAPEPKPLAVPGGDDWLERLVTAGAEEAFCHLRTVTGRFDFDAVARRPAALDEELRPIFAALLSRAAVTLGAVLARAIAESAATPPRYALGPAGLLALPSLPLFWLTRSRSRSADRKAVRAIYAEFRAAGRIDETLPADARAVRDAYDIEVLKKGTRLAEPSKAKPARATESRPKTEDRGSRIEDGGSRIVDRGPKVAPPSPASGPRPSNAKAPSSILDPPSSPLPVPPKLLPRLEAAGVRTTADLLAADPDALAAALHPQATPADVSDWQDQARLCAEVPALAPAEAQLLVACGVTGPRDLAALSPVELWELVVPVAESPDGRRLLRGAAPPDLDAVTRWIDAAKRHRQAA
jgi:hypothetical protein